MAGGAGAMPEYDDDDDIGDDFIGEPGNVSPAPAAAGPEYAGTRQQGNGTYTGAKPLPPPGGSKPTAVPNPGRSRGKNTGENEEKFYLYLILSVSAGLLLFLGVVIGRLIVQRQRARARAKFHVTEPLPNGFADEISEIDADIDLTTTVPPPPPMLPPTIQPGSARNSTGRPDEVVRYSNRNSGGATGGNTNSIRRQDSDTNPRSLQRPGNSQYYYG
ncbi:hypothetical protein B566_EDAN010326 [Ephemera danica]|nr:hypothetical protein B566_EDAN010326 [Ephemera danica]